METNFKKMSDDALQAKLNAAETTTDEKMAIQAELQKRLAKRAAGGASGESTQEASGKTLEEKVAEMKTFIAHKCSVLATNISTDWLSGVITGVAKNVRMNSAYFIIKLDCGKPATKAYGSNLIKISEETVELVKAKHPKTEREPWTEEKIAELIREHAQFVGSMLTKSNGVTGRIVTLVPDKRSHSILYKLSVQTEDGAFKTAFCAANEKRGGYTIVDDLDEEGAALNAKYLARVEKSIAKKALTPEEKLAAALEDLEKAVSTFDKAKANVEVKREIVAKIQAEIGAANANTATEPEAGETE